MDDADSSPRNGALTGASRKRALRAALGKGPADVLLAGGHVFSVFTGDLIRADVALCEGVIVGVGDYGAVGARQVIPLDGGLVVPGYIDAHVHVESSLLLPPAFADAVVVHGTTTALAEPHELTNILGERAVRFFLAARSGLPIDLRIMLPSCVPASTLEQSEGRLDAEAIDRLLQEDGVQGLGEVMDDEAVLAGGDVWDRIDSAHGRVIDGHAPGTTGRQLAAYMLTGARTDHETSDPELVAERRHLGMWTLARMGSVARDLERLLTYLAEQGLERTALCTDDRHAASLVEEHHIDGMLALLLQAGIPPREAYAAATIRPAELYRLYDRGAVAPGLRADLLVLEDIRHPHPRLVFAGGRLVALDGTATADESRGPGMPSGSPPLPRTRLRVRLDRPEDLMLSARGDSCTARVITLVPDSLATEPTTAAIPVKNGYAQASPPEDVALLAVLERHRGTGQIGRGFVRGLGLRRGAIASTVAHDAHHLIVAGVHGAPMAAAVRALEAAGGGLAVADGDRVDVLPLVVAGLMSDRSASEVGAALRDLERRAAALGVSVAGPFMVLSFLSLSVIPSWRLTVLGLVDVERRTVLPSILG